MLELTEFSLNTVQFVVIVGPSCAVTGPQDGRVQASSLTMEGGSLGTESGTDQEVDPVGGGLPGQVTSHNHGHDCDDCKLLDAGAECYDGGQIGPGSTGLNKALKCAKLRKPVFRGRFPRNLDWFHLENLLNSGVSGVVDTGHISHNTQAHSVKIRRYLMRGSDRSNKNGVSTPSLYILIQLPSSHSLTFQPISWTIGTSHYCNCAQWHGMS